LSEDAFLKFNYNRRINRPGLGQLNPFVDITDSLNPHGGNPYLQPELVHALEFGYSKDWDHFSLGANLFYRKGTNTIFPYTSIDSAGVALITPMNFGSSVTYGLEAIFTAQAGKVWNATANLSLFQQNIEGEKDNNSISNEVFSWYVKMVNNFTFWPGNKIQVAANYQAPTATPQGKRIAIYNVDFGMQQSIWKGKGRLGITVTDIFNTQMNGYNMVQPGFTYSRTSKIDTRAVLLTFGYTFGAVFREKLMDNQFSNE
jgi:outer membrane receptor protein involved in Fe transport